MRSEREGTSTLRAQACAPARRLAAALLLVMMATYHTAVLAEPIYYVHMHGYGIWQRKFDTAAAACEHYRVMVLAANDSVGNKPGTAVITKPPPEDIYPNLIATESCVVFWSYPYYSQYYSIGVLAGGCLPGRRPKETVPPESFFAEPWGCEALPCPVPPLKPLPPDDYCAQSLEAGKGKDVYGACSIALTPATQQQAQCLANKIGALNIPYDGPESTVRSPAYQAHFKEIWENSAWLDAIEEQGDPAVIQACAARRAEVASHMGYHGIVGEPAKSDSNHLSGQAIDVASSVVQQMMAAVGTEWSDVQDYVRSNQVNPPACNLTWGGRFRRYDPVHFQLQ
jgi:hypothetical protein